MKTIIALALLLPTLVLAKDSKRIVMETRLLSAMTEYQSLIKTYGLDKMSDEALIASINKLEKLKNVTRGLDEDNSRQARVLCEKNKNPAEIKEARRKIFDLAFTIDGFGYSNKRSTEYVDYWISQFPCEAADHFINDYKTIVTTYASKGVEETEGYYYVKEDIVEYAKTMTRFYCTGLNLPKIFQLHFKMAKQLGYKIEDARGYAQLRTEGEAFICKKW